MIQPPSNLFPGRGAASTQKQWERDSHNGGTPTFKESGWNGETFDHQDNPRGRFKGQPYDWENRKPAEAPDE